MEKFKELLLESKMRVYFTFDEEMGDQEEYIKQAKKRYKVEIDDLDEQDGNAYGKMSDLQDWENDYQSVLYGIQIRW